MANKTLDQVLGHSITWRGADPVSKDAFRYAMRGNLYGDDVTMDAWIWFNQGWTAGRQNTMQVTAHGAHCVCVRCSGGR